MDPKRLRDELYNVNLEKEMIDIKDPVQRKQILDMIDTFEEDYVMKNGKRMLVFTNDYKVDGDFEVFDFATMRAVMKHCRLKVMGEKYEFEHEQKMKDD